MTRFDGAASPTMREQIAIAMTQKASLLENTGPLAEAAAALRILTSQFGQDKEPAIQFVVAAGDARNRLLDAKYQLRRRRNFGL